MEPQKDINVSHTQNNLTNKDFLDVLLKNDPELLFIIKKAEKILAAMYLITNAIEDKEPLRFYIRESSLSFISHLFLLKETPRTPSKLFITTFESLVADILSYLNLAVLSGNVSEMNAEIVKNQIQLVSELIQKRYQGSGYAVALPKGFFEGDDYLLDQAKQIVTESQEPHSPVSHPVPEAKPTGYKGHSNVLYNKMSDITPGPAEKKDIKDRSFVKGDRKEKIINLLKNKSNLTINDFTRVIKDCSEKTIQRELILMVNQGVLKKQGERRWSTYSLA